MRLFLAVDLPQEARAALTEALAKSPPLPGRTTRPEQWHLTVVFLGELPDDTPGKVRAAILSPGDPWPEPFPARLQNWGAFPSPQRGRVLWVGFKQGEEELRQLHRALASRLQAHGFTLEKREFSPHLTLARFHVPQRLGQWLESAAPVGVDFSADRFVLYLSHLGPHGSRHEALETFLLNELRTFNEKRTRPQ